MYTFGVVQLRGHFDPAAPVPCGATRGGILQRHHGEPRSKLTPTSRDPSPRKKPIAGKTAPSDSHTYSCTEATLSSSAKRKLKKKSSNFLGVLHPPAGCVPTCYIHEEEKCSGSLPHRAPRNWYILVARADLPRVDPVLGRIRAGLSPHARLHQLQVPGDLRCNATVP